MERLAIEGGKKTVPEGLEKPWPIITEDDISAVTAVLRRGVLWGPEAPEKAALEKEWAEYCGVKYCLATNTGTSALHACAQDRYSDSLPGTAVAGTGILKNGDGCRFPLMRERRWANS